MDIIFYDFDFNCLRDFARPISINFEKCYCGFGSAEVHFDIKEQDVIYLLEQNKYLFFIADGLSAIVTGWQVGEDITIYARTPEWMLTKRGVQKLSVSNSTAEVVVRTAVASVADFIALGNMANVGTVTSYSTEDVRVLYDVVCEILKSQNLGFKVEPDISQKCFVFSVYSGKESLCLISPSNRTAYDMTYTVDKQDVVTNSGWYERKYIDRGRWDASANSPQVLNGQPSNAYTFYKITSESYDSVGQRVEAFGLWCRKDTYLYCDNAGGTWKISESKPDTIWVYIGGTGETGVKRWDAVLKGIKTETEATAEISQKIRREETSSEVKDLEYNKDYALGDIVRVQLEFGDFKKTESKRITAVNIYYDIDKIGVTPILNSLEG